MELSVENARSALVAMVESGANDGLKRSLTDLQTGAIKNEENGWFSIGAWRVNLQQRLSVVTIDAGPIFAEYSGVFQRDDQGKWIAVITNEVRN